MVFLEVMDLSYIEINRLNSMVIKYLFIKIMFFFKYFCVDL